MNDHTHSTDARRELQMARSMCWHCQSEMAGEYFCDRCVKVQPVSKDLDYFTCFGLLRRLAIDPQMLEAKFYELSRAFHPDFYQNKSDAEQTISLDNSAMLNTAYRTLRDPIQRAEYLLDHGMLDRVTHRKAMKDELVTLVRMLTGQPPAIKGDLPAPAEPPVAAKSEASA